MINRKGYISNFLTQAEKYNTFLKSDVDSFIEFHDSPEYKKFMKRLKINFINRKI